MKNVQLTQTEVFLVLISRRALVSCRVVFALPSPGQRYKKSLIKRRRMKFQRQKLEKKKKRQHSLFLSTYNNLLGNKWINKLTNSLTGLGRCKLSGHRRHGHGWTEWAFPLCESLLWQWSVGLSYFLAWGKFLWQNLVIKTKGARADFLPTSPPSLNLLAGNNSSLFQASLPSFYTELHCCRSSVGISPWFIDFAELFNPKSKACVSSWPMKLYIFWPISLTDERLKKGTFWSLTFIEPYSECWDLDKLWSLEEIINGIVVAKEEFQAHLL